MTLSGAARFDSAPGHMGKTCPDCGGDVLLDIVPDPRAKGTTHREQYSCIECGAVHGGGSFR